MSRPNPTWKDWLPSGGINDSLKSWHEKQPDRIQTCASPSTLTECPRVVWLRYKKGIAPLNEMGWGVKQRLLLGRITENTIASQLRDEGKLLWHWKDDVEGESVKFTHGEGLDRIEGTPDLLIKLDDKVLISDSKTSRSDSYAYVPITDEMIWTDYLWYKYKLQVTAYYMLCHWNKDWFERGGYDLEKTAALYGEATVKANQPPAIDLPEACHLFSYGMDTGIVHRELTWKPDKEDARKVLDYTRRWNTAYASDTMPGCTCNDWEDGQAVKFCPFGVKEAGQKTCSTCCDDNLTNLVEEE